MSVEISVRGHRGGRIHRRRRAIIDLVDLIASIENRFSGPD